MILVFGGTTEGRKAAKELEESGKTFHYSTKTGEQDIALHHGIRIDGAMDAEAMERYCRDNNIRLIVDAAHPFAQQLHQTVAEVSEKLQLPAIRFERIFPVRDSDIIWCSGYDDIPNVKGALLCTTGVQSIPRLKRLEEVSTHLLVRILPRESSIRLAHSHGATDDQLCFYHEGEDEQAVMKALKPNAILLKESGMTGGFVEKVEAARALGIRIIAIKRPTTPPTFHIVNGEHGLRRMVERLLPDFFPLHSGLTTGTCATAAAIAATMRLLTTQQPDAVPVVLPNGETIHVEVSYGEHDAFVRKEAGDDPDVTDGVCIHAQVTVEPDSSHDEGIVEIVGGEGVGTFTLPGFDYPPGEAAINKTPRQMIRHNLKKLLSDLGIAHQLLRVTISVPGGTEIARRTFNPRLGIEGGISIIGVSGIVKPFSEEAFIESIRKCMTVAKASGSSRVVINSGAKSERYLKSAYPMLPPQAFVEYGNYVGATLEIANELDIPQVTLGMMLGKAVKLAAGHLDTHSRKSVMDKSFIKELLVEAGCSNSVTSHVEEITLARELWDIVPAESIDNFCNTVITHCRAHCEQLLPKGELTIILIGENGELHWQA